MESSQERAWCLAPGPGCEDVPLPTDQCCGNVDMKLFSSTGYAQQLSSTLFYCLATALHSARYRKQILK
eukprot:1150255-Pelagomonas_calceolata.AAC.2